MRILLDGLPLHIDHARLRAHAEQRIPAWISGVDMGPADVPMHLAINALVIKFALPRLRRMVEQHGNGLELPKPPRHTDVTRWLITWILDSFTALADAGDWHVSTTERTDGDGLDLVGLASPNPAPIAPARGDGASTSGGGEPDPQPTATTAGRA